MGIFNRILNILILLLAGGAVFFSVILFQKREELMLRGNKLAEAINEVSVILDDEGRSGTEIADKLDPKRDLGHLAYGHKDPASGQYICVLDKIIPDTITGQAEEIIRQRNELLNSFVDVAKKIGQKIGQNNEGIFKESEFEDLSYDEQKDKLLDIISKVNARDNGLIQQLSNTAGIVGIQVEKTSLKSLDAATYQDLFNSINTKLEDMKKRIDGYEDRIDHIKKNKKALANSDKKPKETKDENADKKAKNKKLYNDIEDLKGEIRKLKSAKDKMKEKVAKWKKLVGLEGVEPPKLLTQGDPIIWHKLEGEVIDVNKRWNFVVINLGKRYFYPQKIGKKVNRILTPIPVGYEMVISRGSGQDKSFVGRVKIVNVKDHCSIANILSSAQLGSSGDASSAIQTGDTVTFSKEVADKITADMEGKGGATMTDGGFEMEIETTEKSDAPEEESTDEEDDSWNDDNWNEL